jgi:hypothetical protein
MPPSSRLGAPNVTAAACSFNRFAPSYTRRVGRPPITIRCECGEKQDVAYGDRWVCESCGRSWNTQQIPGEEYEGLLRRVRRHQLEVLVLAASAAAVLVPLIVFVSARFILLTLPALFLWIFVVLPAWRRRYRRTAREAPRWELHPE